MGSDGFKLSRTKTEYLKHIFSDVIHEASLKMRFDYKSFPIEEVSSAWIVVFFAHCIRVG